MQKQVIFNVGEAFSSYIEVDDKKMIVDLGKSEYFCPINNFLLPLAHRRGFSTMHDIRDSKTKHFINQLVISHPHDDHLYAIEDFHKSFCPELLTMPNDIGGQEEKFKINWDLISNPSEDYVGFIRDNILVMRRPGRPIASDQDSSNPLVSCDEEYITLHFIPPKDCEDNLSNANYANNVSITLFLEINGHTTYLPGDLMNDGMQYLLETDETFKDKVTQSGIDFLIAPHHGLSSEDSFPDALFENLKNNKTFRLNIIPEKTRNKSAENNRSDVDEKYYSSNYCEGNNNLEYKALMTNGGHVVIDYEGQVPVVKVINSADELVNEFMS